MKTAISLFVSFFLVAQASANLSEPPDEIVFGKKVEGVQLGLWSEKNVYASDELKNVGVLARQEHGTAVTVGIDGSLYSDSFIEVFSNNQRVLRFPLAGGVDGAKNSERFSGGISREIQNLPPGNYLLIWRTEKLESNTLKFAIN